VKYSKKSPYFLTTQRVYDEGLYYKNARAAQRKLNRTMKRVIKEFPEYSIEKIPYNNLLFKLKRRQNDLATAKEVLFQNAMIYKTNYGDFSPMYHQTQLKIAEFLVNYENNFNDADDIFKRSFDVAVSDQFHPFHIDYFNYLLLYADLLTL